ncbi:UDP-arabinose 4-epimerase [Hoeflea marina]|uniref:UDP-glucose 4-epimerase n=1 Tax=Hoeflea marina TaxID=274592 RepID=A0A317PGI4_9HYPH|nr:UDP-glucose 4-epimerase GalE [Hoeflea marina]PWV95752.1 UDP-arabinose 4-epimerase [Hoeflea marina]
MSKAQPVKAPAGSARVLVTGGAGYIGSHACRALAEAGLLPIVYDNLVFGHEWAVKWGPLERGDIGDRDRLDAVIRQHRPEAVLHFAAFAYVGESVADPGRYYRNNVAGTLTLLEAMRDNGIPRMVFSSSCATYGIPRSLPITEATPQNPINPYGRSKLMVEQMLADFSRAHGIGWTALRYFNAAGACPQAGLGECHTPETHLIPLVLDAARGLREAVTICGTDYDTEDGTCVRDYVHVGDLAEAHVKALARLAGGGGSGAYNLGTNRGHSVRAVIAAVETATGRKVPVVEGPRREGDPAVLVADATRARTELGWTPRFTELARIIETAAEWHARMHA